MLQISEYNYFIRLNIFSYNIGEKVVNKFYYGSKQSLGNNTIAKFISETSGMSKCTAYEYSKRLSHFKAFVLAEYKTSVDNIIAKIHDGAYDPYDILSGYRAFLQDKGSISAITLKQQVITVKNFLEYSDVDISPRKFKLKVKLAKAPRKNIQALSKEDVVDMLNACSDSVVALNRIMQVRIQ